MTGLRLNLPDDLLAVRQWLLRRKTPHTVTVTGTSVKISYLGGEHIHATGPAWRGEQFRLLARLKKRANEFYAPCLAEKTRPVFYRINVGFFPHPGAGEVELRELDLRAAYPTAALRIGYLTDELWRALLAQPKCHRTRLLGALGSRKTVYEFDGSGSLVGQRVCCHRRGRAVWRAICRTVGNDLVQLSDTDPGFVAFWVDNYFTVSTSRVAHNISSFYRLRTRRVVARWKTENALAYMTVDDRKFCWPFDDRPRLAAAEFFVDQKKRLR